MSHFQKILRSCVLWVTPLFCTTALSEPAELLFKALGQIAYQQDCHLKIERHFESPLLGTKKNTPAELYLYQNKFRFEVEDQGLTTILYDSQWYWILESEDSKSPPHQITRTRQNNLKFSDFLNPKKTKQSFELTPKKTPSGWDFILNPKKDLRATLALEKMVLKIEEGTDKNKLPKLIGFDYQDDVGNQVSLNFKSLSCTKKLKTTRYQFKPKKDQSIIEL